MIEDGSCRITPNGPLLQPPTHKSCNLNINKSEDLSCDTYACFTTAFDPSGSFHTNETIFAKIIAEVATY